jgi:hypothetical protein
VTGLCAFVKKERERPRFGEWERLARRRERALVELADADADAASSVQGASSSSLSLLSPSSRHPPNHNNTRSHPT